MTNRSLNPSLSQRLLLAAAAFLIVALIVSGWIIDGILNAFVSGQIEKRLDGQILALASAVSIQENLPPTLKRDLDVPPYDRVLSGWYWQIDTDSGSLTSRSLGNESINTSKSPVVGPAGEELHIRSRRLSLPDQAGTITVLAAAPESDIQQPLKAARSALVWSLLALGAALIAAMAAQIWLGLSPLRKLASQLSDVRTGSERLLPTRQPVEVAGLVSEINALLLQNRESLERARSHIANLAHGLKTPLAALDARLGSRQNEDTAENIRLIQLMDKRISHHLRRARSIAQNGDYIQPVSLLEYVNDLTDALRRIYREKRMVVEISIAPSIWVKCDGQDLHEMLGNLLDNAFKWGKSLVVIQARVSGQSVTISINDDGPGVPDTELGATLRRGERLDETVEGTGFGLSICSEIASLYGGNVELSRSISGGLCVKLTLPVAYPS